MCLHGRMKQQVRMGIYAQFCEKRSVLFSTDVASRGLDFNKAVDWVVQVGFWLYQEATFVFAKEVESNFSLTIYIYFFLF